MSHGDTIDKLPRGGVLLAITDVTNAPLELKVS